MKIRQIRTKLSLYYGIFFSLMLCLLGGGLYFGVETVVTQTVNNSLDAASELVKKIVETGVINRKSEVFKDSLIAHSILGDFRRFDPEIREEHRVVDVITEERSSVELPVWLVGGKPASRDNSFVDQVQEQTGGDVVLYQWHPRGFVSVQSTFRDSRGKRIDNQLIPLGSFIHTLMLRERPYYRREYLNGEWYLSSYSLLTDGEEILGALYVAQKQIQMDKLREDILSIRVGDEGFPYIIDRVSNVVIHPTLEGSHLVQFQYIVDLVSKNNTRFQYRQTDPATGKTEEYVAFFKYIPELNWIAVVGSSVRDFYGDLYRIRNIMFPFFGFALVLSMMMSFILGNRISRPIISITEKIREISEGEADFASHLEIRASDEVGRLAEYFNTFVAKLNNLQELEHRGVEVLLKDTQMNALQAQINPHFLYNTLETIRFMIRTHDDRAEMMVQLLADLFRVSIGKGENYVTIQKELEHAELYLSLQKIRYADLFRVKIDVPREVRELYTLKFIIQPFLENSITHAFEEIDEGGLITLEAALVKNRIRVSIRDNGSGMPRKQLESIRRQLLGLQKKSSVGLQNVSERIRLHFGDEYGMEIFSTPGSGTTVYLWLPVLKEMPSSTFIASIRSDTFI